MSLGSIYLVMDQVFSLIFSFLFLVMIARYLGVDELGKYQFSMSIVALVSVVTNFGVSAIANREIAKSKNKLSLYLGSALFIRLFVSLPLTLLCIGLIMWLSSKGVETNAILLLAVFYSWLLSSILLINGALTSLHMAKQVVLINGSYKVIAVLAAFIFLYDGTSLVQLMIALICIVLFVFLIQFKYVRSFDSGFRMRCSGRFCKTYILKSMPLLFISIAELISLRIDTVMIGVISTTINVGLYTGAYNIYIAGAVIPLAVTRVFFPNFVSLYSSIDGKRSAFKLMGNVRNLFLVYSLSVGGVFVSSAYFIVPFVFGDDFDKAGDVLLILAFSLPFISLNRLYNYTLLGLKENTYYLKISIVGATCNVAMNMVLIPMFSIVGAAVATVVTEGLVFLLSYMKVKEIKSLAIKG
jgi:O-antigen/teichoic acid export membrane protein